MGRKRSLGYIGLGAALLMAWLLWPAPVAKADSARRAAAAAERSPTSLQERRLVQSLIDLRQGRLEDARRNAFHLVSEQPDFRLAQVVYGDVLLAHTGRLRAFGQDLSSDAIGGHQDEARARLRRYLEAPPADAVPACLLKLPPGAPPAVVVDLKNYRLFLFEGKDDRVVRTSDFYVSIGKEGGEKQREGDEKTPVGVYRVSSFLPGSTLPDLYGVGAFPLDYPNGWDRLKGRTGSGIWIHGTESDRYSRPPQSSRGCVTLSNDDFGALRRRVRVAKTSVVVEDSVEWIDRASARRLRASLEAAIDEWERDWESRDSDRYLSHYSQEFRTGGMSRERFAEHKRQVNASKKYIQIKLDDLGIFRYPGESGLAMASFTQTYKSDSFTGKRRKNQYWRREGGAWRIVLEEGL